MLLAVVLAIFVGWIIGVSQKGIHIQVGPKVMEGPVSYNESTEELLPPEVQKYYTANRGYTEF